MDTAKGSGGLDGHRVVDPQALSQSLVNKVNTFEESVGVLLWKCLVHVEALQLVDLPLLIGHCTTVLDQVGERDLEVKHVRRQEALVIHYFHCIMKHSEKLSAKAVFESMRDTGLISGILHYLANKECTPDLKAVGMEGLSMLADSEDFQCDMHRFLPRLEDIEALREIEKVAEVVLQEGLLKRSDVRPLLDLFAKCKRMN
ncbi:hypothetical protein Pmar_PMAR009976 [Perkinsus marinus ATCC 50983]|uniref:Uncharacterized protein n=1 Tax=Perkinsus marinus (strain ATCC 50983 / TXsc) TaxID=423536 RepID=C5L2R9_PERM5|nr:hypothetical protein Pmar_PMAR009976 [Perkinsus marinus ATCC 50983]EER08984.1 hypothetical protein Pmar_PMAR009976 [Perkinsus marinus ATCC 50983]|eukprot:XP_002777168.1 hypothetical protein Pmar_PMAR009976 [Perkinsus marinus ATCC 50983]